MFGSLIRRKTGQRRPSEDDVAFEFDHFFAVSTAVPRPCERRDDERIAAMLARRQAGRAPAGEQLIRVRNVSAGGLMAEAGQPCRRRRRGLDRAFVAEHPVDRGLDREGTVGLQVRPECRPRRAARRPQAAPRLPPAAAAAGGQLQGQRRVGKVYYTVDVHDISLGGMKVEPIEEYCLGKKVVVVVESLRPVRGKVRWFSDRKAGIVFDEPLTFEELAEWIGKRLELASLKASYQALGPFNGIAGVPISSVHSEGGRVMADEVAVLAGGCFWCTEAVFLDVVGVKSVESGYTGGETVNPTYKQVCGGDTGHAEAIRITFDPDEISYADLLDIFFATHDPTQLNRQGNDVGTQYRSAIFPQNEEQRAAAQRGDRAGQRAAWRQGRDDDRARRPTGIRPRIITRIIGPARGRAIPIAWRSSRPSWPSSARASRRG